MADIGILEADARLNAAKFNRGAQQMRESLGEQSTAFNRAERESEDYQASIDRTSTGFLNLRNIVLAAGAAIGSGVIAQAINNIANETTRLKAVADNIGATTSEVQLLRDALVLSGQEFDESLETLQDISEAFAEAANNGGTYEQALRRIGISAKDIINLPLADQLRALGEGLLTISNPQERLALLREIGINRVEGVQNLLTQGQFDQTLEAAGRITQISDTATAGLFEIRQARYELFENISRGFANALGNIGPELARISRNLAQDIVPVMETFGRVLATVIRNFEALARVVGTLGAGLLSIFGIGSLQRSLRGGSLSIHKYITGVEARATDLLERVQALPPNAAAQASLRPQIASVRRAQTIASLGTWLARAADAAGKFLLPLKIITGLFTAVQATKFGIDAYRDFTDPINQVPYLDLETTRRLIDEIVPRRRATLDELGQSQLERSLLNDTLANRPESGGFDVYRRVLDLNKAIGSLGEEAQRDTRYLLALEEHFASFFDTALRTATAAREVLFDVPRSGRYGNLEERIPGSRLITDLEAALKLNRDFQPDLGLSNQFATATIRAIETGLPSRQDYFEGRLDPRTYVTKDIEEQKRAMDQYVRRLEEIRPLIEEITYSMRYGFNDIFYSIIDGTRSVAESIRRSFLDLLQSISDTLVFEPLAQNLGRVLQSALLGQATPRAAGGPTLGLHVVGEQGPELLYSPRGGSVLNNHMLRALAAGGGGTTVNLTVNNVGTVDARKLWREIKRLAAADYKDDSGWRVSMGGKL